MRTFSIAVGVTGIIISFILGDYLAMLFASSATLAWLGVREE